jgi:hypothetical protein
MQQVRMNIVPASDFGHRRVGRQVLLNNPLLLSRSQRRCRSALGKTVTVDMCAHNLQINGQTISQANALL